MTGEYRQGVGDSNCIGSISPNHNFSYLPEGSMTFRDGWSDFIRGNNYRVGDKLYFQYIGNTTFRVDSSRDGQSLDNCVVGGNSTTSRGPRPRWLTNEEYSFSAQCYLKYSRLPNFAIKLGATYYQSGTLTIPREFARTYIRPGKSEVVLMNRHGPFYGAKFQFYDNICLLTDFSTITKWPCNDIQVGDVCAFEREDDWEGGVYAFRVKVFSPMEGDVSP
ncbi:uncharacterized protein [Spinacia oleracea]|uniref:TF-B3 domain-containing protein n=1 Tax=Spinacia oleracea TaxID=3562 RepID=A0ABM3R7A6_SPIOL|nr:uncharacterized protein LOC130466984 [Spinacia oleracea]XP_056691486.1 uncharacterized protein LOC130466984 [Spinacia oleracea]